MKKFYQKAFIAFSFIVALQLVCYSSNAQTITTVAGRAGYLGDGGAATSGILPNPYSIAIDASSNVYIAASGDGHIRKVDAATGLISTFAGNTGAVYYGDGGPATAAYFNFTQKSGLVFDKNGNMYISDCANNRIRKIDVTTGVINTIAGTGTAGYSGDGSVATAAKINAAEGIVTDATGNIYFSDYNNNVIRKIAAGTQIISTVAGTLNNSGYSGDNGQATAAAIGIVERIAIDVNGNLYLADTKDNVVRKIDASTNVITTVAGTGTTGYSGDGGPATSAKLQGVTGIAVDAAGNIYITDRVGGTVRMVDATTHNITTIAGTGVNGFGGDGGAANSAKLNAPTDISVDAAGNIYIGDYSNNRVRKITVATNNISTIAGDGFSSPLDGLNALSSFFYFPGALAVDATGDVYTGDFFKVRRYSPATGGIYIAAGGGGNSSIGAAATEFDISFVRTVTVDNKGTLYFTDEGLNKVLMVDTATQKVQVFAGNGNTDGSGNNGPATGAGLRPMNLAADSNNNIFISDIYSVIWKVNAQTGNISVVAGSGTLGYSGDNGPALQANLSSQGAGIALDKQGNLYIADQFNFRIRKVDAVTGTITTIAGNGTNGFSGDGGPATNAELGIVKAVTLDTDGNIYIADGNRVRKVTASTGIITTIAGGAVAGYAGDGGPASAALLNSPYSLAMGKDGNLYVSDFGNHVIRRISNLALPLSFLSFSGTLQKGSVNLVWQTASEINTSYFDVMRSADGSHFTSIGNVQAKNNPSINNYAFTDVAALQAGSPIIYYRLKEVDKDGAANYSKTVAIKTDNTPFTVKVSPNPVADNINIYSSINAANANITLVNANGKVLRRINQALVAGQPVTINTSNLAKGLYFVTVDAAGTQMQVKVVK